MELRSGTHSATFPLLHLSYTKYVSNQTLGPRNWPPVEGPFIPTNRLQLAWRAVEQRKTAEWVLVLQLAGWSLELPACKCKTRTIWSLSLVDDSLRLQFSAGLANGFASS
jgi:hypothetical protein